MLKTKLLGATAAAEPIFIEDVFSTYLYTGNGSTQTITNGIDLAGEGGLVWIKNREEADSHILTDTERGATETLVSNTTAAEAADADTLTAFNADGFDLDADVKVNTSTENYASWTFRKAPRFFDVVTYTGDGVDNRTIPHNLGADIGTCIIKRTDSTGNWMVWHRSLPDGENLRLQSTDAEGGYDAFYEAAMTDTTFGVRTYTANTNISGATYVAYLFAHDPLGPSGDGSDGLIACGTWLGDGSVEEINLGWEPQFILYKAAGASQAWFIRDNMRGWGPDISATSAPTLRPNTSDAEASLGGPVITSTGFKSNLGVSPGYNYIYIAIRRGPMREPTSGTQVFAPVVYTGTNVDNRLINTGILTDMVMIKERNDTVDGMVTGDRLRGNPYLLTGTTAAENTDADSLMTPTSGVGNAFAAMNGVGVGNDTTSKVNADTTANNHVAWAFRRAPGFFDVVAYTGTGSARTVDHNLGVVPELMIVKKRAGGTARAWAVYANNDNTDYLVLNTTAATADDNTYWNDTSPTASVFTVGTANSTNESGGTYIAYLFATLPGISKVGSYTGNGSSQTINCGFTGGARFVLIKRTDSTGNWLVGDTARGIVAGNDPYLELNTTAPEEANEDLLDTDNSGFIVNETSPANANVSSATYIFFAVS